MSNLGASVASARRFGGSVLNAAVQKAYRERVAAGLIKPQEAFERKPVVLISTNGGRLVEADKVETAAAMPKPLTRIEQWKAKKRENRSLVQLNKKHLAGVEYPTIALIKKVVCEKYDLSTSVLISEDKPNSILYPRQVGMYLARKLTLVSSPEIGRRFGRKDHTTVLHAAQMIEARRLKNSTLDLDIRAIRETILSSLNGADHFLEYWGA